MSGLRLFLLTAFIAFSNLVWAQKSNGWVDFGSYGTKPCKIYRDHPSELSANHIGFYAASNHVGVAYELSWNHFQEKYAFGLFVDMAPKGFSGAGVTGSFFFKRWEKESKINISSDFAVGGIDGKATRVRGKLTVKKQTAIGINVKNSLVKNVEGSFGFRLNNAHFEFDQIKYYMIEFGPVIMTVKGGDVQFNKFVGRTKRVSAGVNIILTPWAGANITPSDSAAATTLHNISAKDILDSPTGFHVYVERYSNFVYHKDAMPILRWGWYWRLGIIKPPFAYVQSLLVDEEVLVKPEICVGFFVNFD